MLFHQYNVFEIINKMFKSIQFLIDLDPYNMKKIITEVKNLRLKSV
jgi:hypothetical protein